MTRRNLYSVLYPQQKRIMDQFGENLLLALKRRNYTKKLISERTGFDPKTIKKVFDGDPSVAIGVYLKVMSTMGMEENFARFSAHDEVELRIQKLLAKETSAQAIRALRDNERY